MLDALLSVASGGLLGGVLSLGKMFASYKEKKMTLSHEIDMAQENRLTMEQEMALATVKGAIDLELQESEDDARNLTAAIEAESVSRGDSSWVNDLKASTRPILTYSLVVCAFGLVAMSPENPWANEFIFMAMTAVTFWFGDRPRRGFR